MHQKLVNMNWEGEMSNWIRIATVALGSVVFAAWPAVANPPALWWTTRVLRVSGVNTCLSMAAAAMREQGLDNIQSDPQGVGGTTQNSYAIITCIAGSNNSVTAVIMVAGNDRGESEQVRNGLADKIVNIKTF
jgi:hypothetical protein